MAAAALATTVPARLPPPKPSTHQARSSMPMAWATLRAGVESLTWKDTNPSTSPGASPASASAARHASAAKAPVVRPESREKRVRPMPTTATPRSFTRPCPARVGPAGSAARARPVG